MCFGGGGSSPPPTPAPAPAPAPPAPLNESIEVGSNAQKADVANFGTTTPTLRVDRSATAGGSTAGGTGLSM